MNVILMLAKLAAPGLLKIKIILSKGYDVIISVYDVTNKVLSRDSNYIVDVVMWEKWWEKYERSNHTFKPTFLRGGLR